MESKNCREQKKIFKIKIQSQDFNNLLSNSIQKENLSVSNCLIMIFYSNMTQMEDGTIKKESITIKMVLNKVMNPIPEKAPDPDQAKVILMMMK